MTESRPVLTRADIYKEIDRAARERLDMSGHEFFEKWAWGTLDESDPKVARILARPASYLLTVMNEPEIATREEVLALLTDQARAGSVSAAAALARELRAMDKKQENEVDAAIDAILAREG